MRLDPTWLKKSAVFGLVSTELVAYIGGAFLIGKWLDSWLQFSPFLTILFSCLGLVLAVWKILKWLKKEEENLHKKDTP